MCTILKLTLEYCCCALILLACMIIITSFKSMKLWSRTAETKTSEVEMYIEPNI